MDQTILIYLLYSLYAVDLALIIALIVRLYHEVRVSKIQLTIGRLINFVKYEINGIRRSYVDALHFSILGGVSLSMLYTILYPWIYKYVIAHYVMFAIALPFIVGLLAAFAWRVQVFIRAINVHNFLGVSEEFRSKSLTLQGILMAIILLTTSTLVLTILPSLFYIDVKLTITIADYLLIVLFYARPEVNLFMDFDRGLPNIRMPFNIKDVIDGKVDASQVKMGVEKLSEFEDYEVHSFSSCVEIGACEEACPPAVAAGRPLSPRVLVRKLAILKDSSGLESEAFKVINEDELWACTTCGACTYSCPVGVRHIDIIMDLRRKLVELGKLDQKKSNLLLNLSQYNNSMGMPNYGRHDWLKELGVKTVQENPDFEYLLWVGCMGSFDNRAREIITSLIDILKSAGLLDKVAILGDEETCCGDPARRLGEEGRFQELALNNIELFKKYNVRNIITICPHGYNTFKNDYPKIDPWMSNVKVLHHSEFLKQLIDEGRIKVGKNNVVFTIHDPCYLARYNGVVEPQRNIVRRLGELREARKHGTQTFCCGAGGANYWYDVPEKKRISHIRLEQLMETNAQTIVTLCPFCNAMLTDAARVKGVEDKVKILDISEIVKASIIKPEEVKAS